ncbi:MAG: DEAD/DEAH box helicase [Methylococcaceae bacterium]|nr:MAG: DEAD/DEAH box helicase [Methylococcaceae bacterium]
MYTRKDLDRLFRPRDPQPAAEDQPNPAVLAWLDSFGKVVTPAGSADAKPPSKDEALFYLLHAPDATTGQWHVTFARAEKLSDDCLTTTAKKWTGVERALQRPPAFVTDEDLVTLRLLVAQRSGTLYPLAGQHGETVLQRLLASRRFYLAGYKSIALNSGEARPGCFRWKHNTTGLIVPTVETKPPSDAVLVLNRCWYVDGRTGCIGLADQPYPPQYIAHLLAIPPLSEADLPLIGPALDQLAPDLPAPTVSMHVIETPLMPLLKLGTLATFGVNRYRSYPYLERAFDYAQLFFRYGKVLMDAGQGPDAILYTENRTARVKRRLDEEARLLASLEAHGFARVLPYHLHMSGTPPATIYGLESKLCWPDFLEHGVPQLLDAGWKVDVPKDFRHRLLRVESYDAEIRETKKGWFDLDMGVVVDGRRMPLAPMLHELLRRDPRWLDASRLDAIADQEQIELHTANGNALRVPAERLKPLARTLIDLFTGQPGQPWRISSLDAPRLAELNRLEAWQFTGMKKVQRLAERLRFAPGVSAVAPPRGFTLQLRPYQLEGLAWLQFLREQELAGILADDMGLGKTAQTLAHLLLEKEAGRLDRPALVVLPTSLLFNWKREAERFAPGLRLLSLHGQDRKQYFADIPHYDVILTTYPLLWRDENELAAHPYHLLILDEAQTVKNAASLAARTVRKLDARHRLCLTGTPLENHLGELWAQFDFLLPGFLGDGKSFLHNWRVPIEKHGDQLRRAILSRRLQPFILRRRKEDVARELPPKTIIVRSVELDNAQRDLYETVRSAMDHRVQETIAEQGFARSQIIILDALLKLRQVCCDPRLLKSEGAQNVKESAKLELLMSMLPELVDEGRRILVFSQFTAMLALIAKALDRCKLGYVSLTGDTKDREGIVSQFQSGTVPVFLISLKAGGVGLNLTAADTVIHYDPWWNPAAENQATDRAHRIGQEKSVFVYKLVVAGSIEEKILALQDKKAELAEGVLSENGDALSKFGQGDIEALFAPLSRL